jgi:hypothetical protein
MKPRASLPRVFGKMRADTVPFIVGQIRGISLAVHGAKLRPPSRSPSTFQTVSRRISMKMSSRRAGLEGGSVTQHRPQYVDPPTRQSDESLSMPLAFGSLAVVEDPGLRGTA